MRPLPANVRGRVVAKLVRAEPLLPPVTGPAPSGLAGSCEARAAAADGNPGRALERRPPHACLHRHEYLPPGSRARAPRQGRRFFFVFLIRRNKGTTGFKFPGKHSPRKCSRSGRPATDRGIASSSGLAGGSARRAQVLTNNPSSIEFSHGAQTWRPEEVDGLQDA